MISVFEQEMVLQGPNLQRGKQDTGQAAWSTGNDIIRRHLVPAACSNIVIALKEATVQVQVAPAGKHAVKNCGKHKKQ